MRENVKKLGSPVGQTGFLREFEIGAAGADFVFLYSDEWIVKVKEVTNGHGVDVVYESVGPTLADSFQAAKIGGTVVFFGMSGGNPAREPSLNYFGD